MSNIFKTAKASDNFVPTGISAGGLISNPAARNGGYSTVTATPERTGLVSGLSGAGETAANTYQNLYNTVAPGFNDLLSSRLNTFNDSARKAIGDLSQSLATRRILGSSFGQDTINRLQSEQQRNRDAIVADNFIKSLDAQRILTNDQYTARKQQFQTGLDELNLEANLAQNLSSIVNQQFAQNARADAAAQNTTNGNFAGAIIGGLTRIGTGLVSGGLSSFGGFGGGGGAVSAGSYGGVPYPIFG